MALKAISRSNDIFDYFARHGTGVAVVTFSLSAAAKCRRRIIANGHTGDDARRQFDAIITGRLRGCR